MKKKLLSESARAMAAARKTFSTGRPPQPTACAKCGELQPSAVAARRHCRMTRSEAIAIARAARRQPSA